MSVPGLPADDLMHDDFKHFGYWKDGKLYSLITRYGHPVSRTTRTRLAPKKTYKVFWDPKLKGKAGHSDWHLPSLGQMSCSTATTNPSLRHLGRCAEESAGDYPVAEAADWRLLRFWRYVCRPKNGEMLAMCGIGDWVTGILERDGAPVTSVVPKEGGIQWTESYSIVSVHQRHRQKIS